MSSPSNYRVSIRLTLLSLVLVAFAASAGCSATTDSRLVGKWTGPNPGGGKVTYTFREDGNLDVKLSTADTPFPSQWSALSWEGDEITIRLYDYQQNPLVRKVKMSGTESFELLDEAGTSLGTFTKETS